MRVPKHLEMVIGKTIAAIKVGQVAARLGGPASHERMVISFTDGYELELKSEIRRDKKGWYSDLWEFVHLPRK